MALPLTWTLFGKDHVLHRLLLLANMIDRQTAKRLKTDFCLTVVAWRVLAFVCTVGPASAAEVGSAFEADRAEVSRAVARLVRMGMLEREADPSHNRKMILSPTSAGRVLHQQVRRQRQSFFATILQDLSAEDRAMLDSYMGSMALRVDALRCDRDLLDELEPDSAVL